jgi:hypothetical protein
VRLFIAIEKSKYGDCDPVVFDTEEARQAYVDDLLKEYSRDYGKEIKSPDSLYDSTLGQVNIELYDSILSPTGNTLRALLLANFPGLVTDEEVNGCELVEWLSYTLANPEGV